MGILIRMMEGLATGKAEPHTIMIDATYLKAHRTASSMWLKNEALEKKGTKLCILGRKSRRKSIKYDKRKYKRRNRIEIMFDIEPRDTCQSLKSKP